MTRILVVSDSHGDRWHLKAALQAVPDAKLVFHLGDGAREAQELAEEFNTRFFHLVQGNCDWGSTLPLEALDEVEGKRIYACHGHTHLVKHGTGMLLEAAKAQSCAIALYGHTHQAVTNYCDGLLLFNPGSIKEGKFGVIDIAKNGILPVLRNLD